MFRSEYRCSGTHDDDDWVTEVINNNDNDNNEGLEVCNKFLVDKVFCEDHVYNKIISSLKLKHLYKIGNQYYNTRTTKALKQNGNESRKVI